MARVSIITPQKRQEAPLPEGLGGTGRAEACLAGAQDPIHLWLHRLAPGERLEVGPLAADCMAYVWQGEVEAGGMRLASGSSVIAEHGGKVALAGAGKGGEDALVLTFSGSVPSCHGRTGGNVHLLPASQVPGVADLSGQGVGGKMHADGSCPTCEVWLHENHFGPSEPLGVEAAAKGIHSHSEDEVIFITAGAIRLGAKLFPAGTAVAIAANTLYHIAPGPQGMSFINFRPATPSDIRFANGHSMSETGYWAERVARPVYLEPEAA